MMQASPPPVPVIATTAQAQEWLSHFPVIVVKGKSFTITDVRGEGARPTLDAAVSKFIGEGWNAKVLTDVHGRTSLFVSAADKTLDQIKVIMTRFTALEFGKIEAEPLVMSVPTSDTNLKANAR
jgi:hypothetical protein